MERTSKGLRVSLGILIALLISSVWIAVFAAVPTIETPATSSRVQQLIDGPAMPVVTCRTRIWKELTLFECEADSWGRWELSWVNPDTSELTFLDWDGYNKSFGKHLTTDPGELVVKFWDINGNGVVKVVAVNTHLQPCKVANHCYRV